jgi:autotransporter-associated beta strand protein
MLRIARVENGLNGVIGVGTGDMSVTGAVHNNGTISVQPGCTMTFFGPVSGSGAFPGAGTVSFLAGYSPGNSPASVAFGGDVILGGGVTIELGGTEAGTQHDQLVANGSLSLAGGMDLKLIGGYQPVAGDRMAILKSGSLNGRYSAITGTTPGNGIVLHPVYSPSSLTILAAKAGENVWILDGSGSSSVGANWSAGAAPQTIGGAAAFTSIITSDRTVSVDSDLVMGTLSFNSEKSYRLQGGGQIKLRVHTGGAVVNVVGDHTIDAAINLGCDAEFAITNTAAKNSSLIVGAAITDINSDVPGARSLTKLGDGTLVLATENGYRGATKITGGELELVSGGNISSCSEIDNDALFVVSSGSHSTPRIVGGGETRVISGTLSTPSLVQDGLVIGSAGSPQAIPEPSSIVLLVLAALAVAWRRKRFGIRP